MPYGERKCDKCSEIVPRENSTMLLEEQRDNPQVGHYQHDRHLFAVDGPVPCEGSPSRAQYIEGQSHDQRGIYDYHADLEVSIREAYAKMLAVVGS